MHTKKDSFNTFFTKLQNFDLIELIRIFGNRMVNRELDISHIKDLAIESSEAFAKTNSCLLLTDLKCMRFLYITPSVHQVIGYTQKEFLSTGVTGFIKNYCPADRINGMKALDKVTYHQKKIDIQDKYLFQYITSFRFHHSKGYYVWLYNRMFFVQHDADNQPEVLISVFTCMDQFKKDDNLQYARLKFDPNLSFYRLEEHDEYNADYLDILNETDLRILAYLAEGLNNAQIASMLKLSEHTIKDYRKDMLKKAWCDNSAELLSFALRNGLLKRLGRKPAS
jgi:DNA-binding CsgD family transcriptional regulator